MAEKCRFCPCFSYRKAVPFGAFGRSKRVERYVQTHRKVRANSFLARNERPKDPVFFWKRQKTVQEFRHFFFTFPLSLIRNFDLWSKVLPLESEKKKEFSFCTLLAYSYLWDCVSKLLTFEKTQIKFGFLLSYSYLWDCVSKLLTFEKTQIKFGFLLSYS